MAILTEVIPGNPEASVCLHQYARVLGESGPQGEWVMCCSKCGKTIYTAPPVAESGPDKPLLLG